MPGFRRPIMFLVRPAHCAATVIYLARYASVRKVARPEYRYGVGHVAARSKRARRNVALFSCARRHVLSTACILSLVGARSIEASACLSFGTTGTTPWPRWRCLPLSSSLSWWLPALLRWRKVGGVKRVRKVPRGDLARSSYAYCGSHPRAAQGRPPLIWGRLNVCFWSFASV